METNLLVLSVVFGGGATSADTASGARRRRKGSTGDISAEAPGRNPPFFSSSSSSSSSSFFMSAINVIARRKRKASSGRRKIEIKKIENEDARHVSFSKRRSGLFTKACDLATLCGVELALVVYSAAGNPYSFGSPTVESVVDRFLAGRRDRVESGPMNQAGLVQVLNQQCMDLAAQIRTAEERRSSLELRIRAAGERNLLSQLTNDEEDASPMQLEKLKKLLLDLRRKVDFRFVDLLSGKEAIEFNSNLTSSQLVELDVVGGWPGYEL
uniref:MADS7 n=1 Tax=Apostasia odorata TaxID=280455 RepID=A0A1L1WSA6_9ASPA|nr:MADS7 [Apostasia odorata]